MPAWFKFITLLPPFILHQALWFWDEHLYHFYWHLHSTQWFWLNSWRLG